jgi:hypothetical protein
VQEILPRDRYCAQDYVRTVMPTKELEDHIGGMRCH